MATRSRKSPLAIAVLGVELAAAAPKDVRLIPAGEFRAWDGRPKECAAWVCTDEDGARLVAAAAARESAVVIDYEHATLHAKESGSRAPAAGWYRHLEWRPGDGLWAIDVDWTKAAARAIADREYRYLSPVFTYDPETGRVGRLLHAALTNDPALDGLVDLAALAAVLDQPTEDPPMEELLTQLRWLLGLAADANADAITAKLSALTTQLKAGDPAAAAAGFDLAKRLADHAEQLAVLTARADAPDPARWVPIAAMSALQTEHAALQGQLAELRAGTAAAEVDKVVAAALAAGKLVPAQEAWARDYGKKDLAALNAYLETAPVVAKPGTTQSGGGGDPAALSGQSHQSSDVDKAVMKALGLTAAQFAAGKPQEA